MKKILILSLAVIGFTSSAFGVESVSCELLEARDNVPKKMSIKYLRDDMGKISNVISSTPGFKISRECTQLTRTHSQVDTYTIKRAAEYYALSCPVESRNEGYSLELIYHFSKQTTDQEKENIKITSIEHPLDGESVSIGGVVLPYFYGKCN